MIIIIIIQRIMIMFFRVWSLSPQPSADPPRSFSAEEDHSEAATGDVLRLVVVVVVVVEVVVVVVVVVVVTVISY